MLKHETEAEKKKRDRRKKWEGERVLAWVTSGEVEGQQERDHGAGERESKEEPWEDGW